MKKNIFAVAMTFGLILGTSASAQQQPRQQEHKRMERPTAEQQAQKQTDRMKAKLALTDAQAEQVYAFNLQQAQQIQAARETFLAAQQAKREQMVAERKARFEQIQAARNARVEQMKSILTPEQFAQWEQAQQAALQRSKQQHRPHDIHRRGFHGKHGKEFAKAGHPRKGGKHAPAHRHGFRGKGHGKAPYCGGEGAVKGGNPAAEAPKA